MNKLFVIKIFITSFLSLTAPLISAFKPVVEESFDQEMQLFMQKRGFEDGVIAIYKNGDFLLKGYGRLELHPEQVLPIASVSKVVTSAAVYQLIQKKKLSLDTPVAEYLGITDVTDERVKKITVSHLLTHQGGWDRELSEDPLFNLGKLKRDGDLSRDRLAEILLSKELDFTPGEKSVYSNVGYFLLGRMIEEVSGMSYEAYIEKNICKPYGVNIEIAETPTYLEEFPSLAPEDFFSLELCAPSFGLAMNARDLVLLGDHLFSDKDFADFCDAEHNFIQFGSIPDLTSLFRKRVSGVVFAVIIPKRDENNWMDDNWDLKKSLDNAAQRAGV